jgi:hypothetical protein
MPAMASRPMGWREVVFARFRTSSHWTIAVGRSVLDHAAIDRGYIVRTSYLLTAQVVEAGKSRPENCNHSHAVVSTRR